MDSQAESKDRCYWPTASGSSSPSGSSDILMDWVLAIIILLGLVGIGWLVAEYMEYLENIERGAKGMKDEWEEYQKTLKDK